MLLLYDLIHVIPTARIIRQAAIWEWSRWLWKSGRHFEEDTLESIIVNEHFF